jgi:hypothetical protein
MRFIRPSADEVIAAADKQMYMQKKASREGRAD